MNPLDQALTNVIQNLIKINDGESNNTSGEDMSFFEDPCEDVAIEPNSNTENNQSLTTSKMDFCSRNLQSWRPTNEYPCSPTAHTLKRTVTSIDLPSAVDNNGLSESSLSVTEFSSKLQDGEIIKLETLSSAVSHVSTTANTTTTIPVFSIGPLPTSIVSSVSSSIKSVQFSNPLIVGPSNRFFAPMFGAAAAESDNFADNFATSSSIMSSTEEEELIDREQRSPRSIESITDSDNISIDSSSSLDTVKEFSTVDLGSTPSTSTSKEELQENAICLQKESTIVSTKIQTPEEVLATRADRLKCLEEQADWLMKKMNATSKRSTALCTRLEELHEAYGEPPVPPPMPDILPNRRLPSSLLNLPRQVRVRNYLIGCKTNCRDFHSIFLVEP